MRNRYIFLLSFVTFMVLVSCATNQPPSTTYNGPRTIVLNGDTISENERGGFTSWYCKDFIKEEAILVEVGFFDDLQFEGSGFILFDGGNSGEFAMYQRKGLDHRWDWGPEVDYSFVIKTDGLGLYYDFSTVPEGETTKPNTIYKCYQR